MRFVRKSADLSIAEDSVFSAVSLAKKAESKFGSEAIYNATIGSLYNEEEVIVAFDSVFDSYNQIPKEKKAAYAEAIKGNPNFIIDVYNWVFENTNMTLLHEIIATPGGSGALALAFRNILDSDETVLLPDIAWGSYTGMAKENNLNIVLYEMFDGNHFNINSFKSCCNDILSKQDKLFIIINDPCHNPTGYSMTLEEWKEIITYLNKCANEHAVFLINDIAYIDYAYSSNYGRDYLSLFNDIGDNFVVYLTFSCSKTLTSYGLRCGAGILLGRNRESIDPILRVFEKSTRALWSNVPNAAMENFSLVVRNHKKEFLEEKDEYVALMKERSALFLKEAEACHLPLYPYKEGFFITIKVVDTKERDDYYQRLLDNNIFAVKVNKGIRVAICSLSLHKIKGLAKKMKDLL